MTTTIKLYGERNTNTRYLSKLIELNLHVKQIGAQVPKTVMRLQYLLPGHKLVLNSYFNTTFEKNLGWKHMKVKFPHELINTAHIKNGTALITLTKNPYAWLLSLYRHPYHQYYKQKPDFETFLQTQWETVGWENVNRPVQSPIELWNLKNKAYLKLQELHALNLRSEDLFKNPEQFMENICQSFSIQRKSPVFIDYVVSTKEHGKDSDYYKEYYLKEKWRTELSNTAIDIINSTIDHRLMEYFSYAVL